MSHRITRTVIRHEEQQIGLTDDGEPVVVDADVEIEPPEQHQCSCGEEFDTPEEAVEHAHDVELEATA